MIEKITKVRKGALLGGKISGGRYRTKKTIRKIQGFIRWLSFLSENS